MMPKAVVLLSGGLDSSTTLASAVAEGFDCLALSFRYGQRHEREIASARSIAADFGVPQIVERLDLRGIGGSALTDEIPVPKNRPIGKEIPVTYVPARNTIFLSYALAHAERLAAGEIFIGANAVDYSGYPDCRPEYLETFEAMANLAVKAAVTGELRIRIRAPLLRLSKREIVLKALELGVDLAHTFSCYDPDAQGASCGACDSCRLRKKGFREAGVSDPTRYA